MIHFAYLNYGPSENFRRELKYSFLTPRPFLDPARHRVAIFTDAPDLFAGWPVTAVSIADKMAAYSANGRFGHRVKPAVVLDALRRFGEPVLLMDSDSIVSDGFMPRVGAAMNAGAIMNQFARADPIPALAGFEVTLPHSAYRYDRQTARMFNSGLIGARPDHLAAIEDAIALTDAFLAQPAARDYHFQLEQLAIGEALRVHRIAIAEIHDSFFHHWKRSWRRYAAYRFPKILPRAWDDFSPPRAKLTFNPAAVRLVSMMHSLRKRVG
ncbi:MAG TPA: hypothetical protein VIJ42_13790 [Stellaceae bacterium]